MQAMTGKLSSNSKNNDLSPVAERTLAKYRLQAHYLSNGCFTSESELLSIAKSLKNIPTILIHGTHDLICPPENVLRLAREMPHADLRWVERGGHTPADPAIANALKQAIHKLRQ